MAVIVGAPAPKETPKEAPKLEGDWIVEVLDAGPKEAPKQGPITFRFTENKISIMEGKREKPEEAGYTVDLKQKPATIDIRPEKGKKDMVVLGIIEVNGDTMKICFARDGDRPKEFKSAEGVMLITLKRTKAEK